MRQVVDTRYRPIELLGIGGMSEVYLAHDAVLDRDVALKVLNWRYADDNEVVERFQSEARSAAALCHPNIVSIYDRGKTEDGTYYIVMEYLTGGTLKERLSREGPLPPGTAAVAAIQVAEALKEAHHNGVVHRDVKPQNILITESGDVKVADFGIARAASSATLTRTGVVLGSVHYMSPEQAVGATADPRSDLYSLGVVLYEMLTGELPYDGENLISVAMKHVEGCLRPPRKVDPSIPEGMNAVTVRLLAKDPEERYPDAAGLLEDLDRVGKGLTPTAATMLTVTVGSAATTTGDRQPTAPWEPHTGAPSPAVPYWKQKWRRLIFSLVVAAALLAALALSGTVGLGLWQELGGWSEVPVVDASSTVEGSDVVGQGIEEATSGTLQDTGPTVGREHDTVKSDEPEETAVGTDPHAGSKVEGGASVIRTTSLNAPTVPNTPTSNDTTPNLTNTESNTQQPYPTSVPSPAPASLSAPEQYDPDHSAQEPGAEYGEQIFEDRKETQEEAREEEGEIQERVQEAIEEIKENVQGRVEKDREDRIDDDSIDDDRIDDD